MVKDVMSLAAVINSERYRKGIINAQNRREC